MFLRSLVVYYIQPSSLRFWWGHQSGRATAGFNMRHALPLVLNAPAYSDDINVEFFPG